MTEQAQVGDMVRLTITVEGETVEARGKLFVGGCAVYGAGHTVEILSRATPPLVADDGYYLGYDKAAEADFVVVVVCGVIYLPDATKLSGIGIKVGNPERFAPFHQLVRKEES